MKCTSEATSKHNKHSLFCTTDLDYVMKVIKLHTLNLIPGLNVETEPMKRFQWIESWFQTFSIWKAFCLSEKRNGERGVNGSGDRLTCVTSADWGDDNLILDTSWCLNWVSFILMLQCTTTINYKKNTSAISQILILNIVIFWADTSFWRYVRFVQITWNTNEIRTKHFLLQDSLGIKVQGDLNNNRRNRYER